MRPQTVLDDLAAVELGEMLEFLHDWIASCADARASFRRYTLGLFTVEELRADLARFAFLLGGDGTAYIHREDP
jgi:hypothetical protein